MMNYQLIVRNQRSKGLTIKQALQIALLLAVGIWVIYQIKHSHGNHQDITQSRLKVELGSNFLGRKGTGGWSDSDSDLYLKDVNLMSKNERKEDKDVHVYEDSNFAIQVGQNDEVGSKNGMLKEDFIEKEMESAEGIEGRSTENPRMRKENTTGAEKGKSDFLLKHGGLAKTTTSTSSSVSLVLDKNNPVKESDEKDESRSFHDENGVPQDPNDESSTGDESDELGKESRVVERLHIKDFERSGTSNTDSHSDM